MLQVKSWQCKARRARRQEGWKRVCVLPGAPLHHGQVEPVQLRKQATHTGILGPFVTPCGWPFSTSLTFLWVESGRSKRPGPNRA